MGETMGGCLYLVCSLLRTPCSRLPAAASWPTRRLTFVRSLQRLTGLTENVLPGTKNYFLTFGAAEIGREREFGVVGGGDQVM